MKNQTADNSSPTATKRPAAMKGPTNVPKRNEPPSSERERARNASGTRVVMNECRARPNAAAQNPITNTATARTAALGESSMVTEPAIASTPPIAIVRRSPSRATDQPAGMLPQS